MIRGVMCIFGNAFPARIAGAVLALAGALTLDAPAANADEPISFICNPFPPQKIENGGPNRPGYDVELIREALRRSDKGTSFAYAPWKRAYAMAANGEYSGLCSCSYRTDRNKDFLFTDALGDVAVGFFTLKSQPFRPQSVDDLKGKVVGAVRGYNLSAELDEKHIPYTDVTDETSLVKMLELNRIDVAYSYRDTFRYDAKKLAKPDIFHFQQLRQSPYFVCVSKARAGAEELLGLLNAGLANLKADGTDTRIRMKYLGALE